MSISEKAKIYYNVWCCAHLRRYNAKMKGDLNLYNREQETVLMCLKMKNAKWWKFQGEKQ